MKQPNLPSIQVCNECKWIEIQSFPLCLQSNARSASPVSDCKLWRKRNGAILHCCIAGVQALWEERDGSWITQEKICWNEIYRENLRSTLENLSWEERLRAGIAQPAEETAQCVPGGREQWRRSQDFSVVPSDRARGNGHKLKLKKSCLSIRIFFVVRVLL